MTGIAEMFAEFDGYERYEAALELWSAFALSKRAEYLRDYRRRNAKKAVERTRAWRKANPDRAREISRRNNLSWKIKNPEAYKARAARAKERYRRKYPEKVRERNRRNQAARRARLKAASAGGAA